MTGNRVRIGVLISGRGSNLGALLAAARATDYPADIALVVSNRPGALGLALAMQAGIQTRTVDHKSFSAKADFESALDVQLRAAGVELVCLAGFMRLLSPVFVDAWRDRILNIHPSLLPAFPGLHTHERALAAGVRLHGATVHVVRAETDRGPIVAQGAVPVLDGDTPQILAERVLRVEHRLYPHALRLFAGGRARVDGDRIVLDPAVAGTGAVLLSPPL